jgi:hypothetical protein
LKQRKIVQFFFGVYILYLALPPIVYGNGDGHHHGEHAVRFSVQTLIVPLGLTTLACLASTLALGLRMSRNRKAIFPWHRGLAFTTLALALVHAILVLLFH